MIKLGNTNLILGILGILLTVLAIIISLIFYAKGKRVMGLSVLEFPIQPLISVRREIKDDIEILFRGDTVKNPCYRQLKIKNTGNEPICSDNIIKPITIKVDKNFQIIDWTILESKPNDIDAKLEYDSDENSLVVKFDLFNPEDYIILRYTFASPESPKDNSEIEGISARIEGVKQLNIEKMYELKEIKEEFIKLSGIAGIVYLGMGIFYLIVLLNASISEKNGLTSMPLTPLLVGLFSIFAGIIIIFVPKHIIRLSRMMG